MKQLLTIFLFIISCSSFLSAQDNKYYTSMPHDTGVIYFIKPVEMNVEKSKDVFYADWAVNYTKRSVCKSSVYMNFSIFTKNKPVNSDTAYLIFNSGKTVIAENFISEKRKKDVWKLRYTSSVQLEDVKNIFNEQGELLLTVSIGNQMYMLSPASKWNKTKDYVNDFIASLCK